LEDGKGHKVKSVKITVSILLFVCSVCLTCLQLDVAAQENKSTVTVGHFTFKIPIGWNQMSGSDKTNTRAEFESDLKPGLRQYTQQGEPDAHMDEFEIFQKPFEGQLLVWTLKVPTQENFIQKIYMTETKTLESRQANLKSGECRLVTIGEIEVVRVDVAMRNGGTTTNLQFWSPENPDLITTLMIGLRPNQGLLNKV